MQIRSRLAGVALALSATGCADRPPRPPAARPQASAGLPDPVPALEPARWFRRTAVDAWGPTLGEGTLVLLGGRRALVTRGHVRFESAQAPEPLVDIQVVPVAGGALRLIGAGARGVYRFDDPLGPATPIARAEATTKISGLDVFPGCVRVWTDRERETDYIDAQDGHLVPAPAGLPASAALALVFASEREGVGLFEGVGPAVSGDGGRTWRVLGEQGAGDAARVRGLRFLSGSVEARDGDGRPAMVDVASAVLGPYRGLPRPAGRATGSDRALPPPPMELEPPLAYWLRATKESPLTYAIEGGSAAPGHEGKRTRLDLGTGRLVDVEGVMDAAHWPRRVVAGPSALPGHRLAVLRGLDDEGPDGGAREIHVELQHGSDVETLAPVRLPGAQGTLTLAGEIEEDAEHALHFVVLDARQAFMVIQRVPSALTEATPIPGAIKALVHGRHGLAVGPSRVLASSDGGASWSPIAAPADVLALTDELRAARVVELVVSAAGARVGDFVRLGWGPPEPPPPPLPAQGPEVPAPEQAPSPGAPRLVCTGGAPSKAISPIGPRAMALVDASVREGFRLHGGEPELDLVEAPGGGPFTTKTGFGYDEATRTSVVSWLDATELDGAIHRWIAHAPAWAQGDVRLSLIAHHGGRVVLVYRLGEKSALVRVEPDGTSDVAELPRRDFDAQGTLAMAASPRGAVAWVESGELWQWRWGEPPRAALSLPGPSQAITAANPVAGGLVLRLMSKGYGAYRVLPYLAPGRASPAPSLDGWTRFDAAVQHPERLPACAPEVEGVEITTAVRSMEARVDGVDRRTATGGAYTLRGVGARFCVSAISGYFAEGGPPLFVRADLRAGRADGGGDEVRRMRCTWR